MAIIKTYYKGVVSLNADEYQVLKAIGYLAVNNDLFYNYPRVTVWFHDKTYMFSSSSHPLVDIEEFYHLNILPTEAAREEYLRSLGRVH